MDRVAIRQGLFEELAFLEAYCNPRAEEVRAALAAHDAADADECEPEAAPLETAADTTPVERAVPRRARKEN